MAKKSSNRGFRFFKAILGPIYRFYFRPKVVNKEYILEEGPILIVGNHKHIMDQCNAILGTKRVVNYLAKKEYFDGKYAWFFKASGCISVNRSIHDQAAKSSAIEVLENGGAIGLFPEGTRNALKKEKIEELYDKYTDKNISFKKFKKKVKNHKTSQILFLEDLIGKNIITDTDLKNNIYDIDSYLRRLIKEKKITKKQYDECFLLPFKFGAVSMAQKTNATIIPYGISGDYRFRSKNLKVVFGKPFKVNDMNLEEANKKLEKIVRDLINEGSKDEL